jgi:hypothetical protein
LAYRRATTAKTLVMSGPAANNPLSVRAVVLLEFIGAQRHRINANGIWRQRCGLSKLCSRRHISNPMRFCIPNYHFYWTHRFPGSKGGTDVKARKGIPLKHVDLPLLLSIEATGDVIRFGTSFLLLASICNSPGYA